MRQNDPTPDGDRKTRLTKLRTWWRETDSPLYRCVLFLIGLDCLIVGPFHTGLSTSLMLAAVCIGGAVWWDN